MGSDSLQRATLSAVVPAALSWSYPAIAGHPLITEDTGTQGHRKWQIELTLDRSRSSAIRERSDSSAAVLSYGAGKSTDVILTVPYERTRTEGEIHELTDGLGDIEIAAKSRFFEFGQTSLAVRPGISFPTGDDRDGLGSGRIVPSVFVVLSHEPAAWGFHLHLGYTANHNVHSERRNLYHASIAVTYRSSPTWMWVADISAETNPDSSADKDLRSAVLGAIWSVRPDLDIDAGYRKGLSGATHDGAWLFGLTYRF